MVKFSFSHGDRVICTKSGDGCIEEGKVYEVYEVPHLKQFYVRCRCMDLDLDLDGNMEGMNLTYTGSNFVLESSPW